MPGGKDNAAQRLPFHCAEALDQVRHCLSYFSSRYDARAILTEYVLPYFLSVQSERACTLYAVSSALSEMKMNRISLY